MDQKITAGNLQIGDRIKVTDQFFNLTSIGFYTGLGVALYGGEEPYFVPFDFEVTIEH